MTSLSLVKTLSYLQEEQKYADEILLGSAGIAFTRGTITEISGEPSSGKTSLALSLLAKLTVAGEICSVVDGGNSFDPRTAVQSGVVLENLLWVKCGRDVERSFMSADLLIQAKGFGAVWLNLHGVSRSKLRLVPKTYWYRYRSGIKATPTMLIVTSEDPITSSASQRALFSSRERTIWSGNGRFKLLREFHISLNSRKQFIGGPVHTLIEADYSDV